MIYSILAASQVTSSCGVLTLSGPSVHSSSENELELFFQEVQPWAHGPLLIKS